MKIPYLKKNGKYSFFDSVSSKINGYSEYEYLDFFQEGFARGKQKNKWFYVDVNGLELNLKHNYSEIDPFQDGIAAVRRDNQWRFINKHGIEITLYGYEEYNKLTEGFVKVMIAGEYGYDMEKLLYGDKDDNLFVSKYYSGLIDITGFQIVEPSRYISSIEVQDDFILIGGENHYEGIGFNGEKLFSTSQYSFISSFYKDRAIAITRKHRDIFLIDRKLNKLKILSNMNEGDLGHTLTIDYKNISGFLNDFYAFKKNNKWGFINLEGEEVSEFKYDDIIGFLNPEFAVVGKMIYGNMRYALLSRDFKELTPFIYSSIRSYREGASVELNSVWGFIDQYGIEIIHPQFTRIKNCVDGFLSVSVGDYKYGEYYGKYGFYNVNGQKVCPLIYDWVGDFVFGYAEVNFGNKYGFIDSKGDEVVTVKYDSILERTNKLSFVERDGKRFVIDYSGVEYLEKDN
ncbi:MAG: WG repeat-containing protein [Agriterribacter sp.]